MINALKNKKTKKRTSKAIRSIEKLTCVGQKGQAELTLTDWLLYHQHWGSQLFPGAKAGAGHMVSIQIYTE